MYLSFASQTNLQNQNKFQRSEYFCKPLYVHCLFHYCGANRILKLTLSSADSCLYPGNLPPAPDLGLYIYKAWFPVTDHSSQEEKKKREHKDVFWKLGDEQAPPTEQASCLTSTLWNEWAVEQNGACANAQQSCCVSSSYLGRISFTLKSNWN